LREASSADQTGRPAADASCHKAEKEGTRHPVKKQGKGSDDLPGEVAHVSSTEDLARTGRRRGYYLIRGGRKKNLMWEIKKRREGVSGAAGAGTTRKGKRLTEKFFFHAKCGERGGSRAHCEVETSLKEGVLCATRTTKNRQRSESYHQSKGPWMAPRRLNIKGTGVRRENLTRLYEK